MILHAILATFRRDLLLLRRQRALVIQAVIVPLAMLILATMVYGGVGDSYPIALANESNSPQGRAAEQAIRNVRSDITPYFTIIETDPAKARDDLRWGRINVLVVIPHDFAQTRRLQLESFNVNADAAKNYRGRLEMAVNQMPGGTGGLTITDKVNRAEPHTVWRSAFLGGSSVLLALWFGALLVASNLFVLEREGRTRKEILLTPLSPVASGIGNIMATVVVSLLFSLPPLGLAYWIAHFDVGLGRLLLAYLGMLPTMVACAGIGLLAGHLLKYFRASQPVVTLGSIVTFFVCGGFSMVAYLPPAARVFSVGWPFSRIFTWFNPFLQGFGDLGVTQLLVTIAAAVVALLPLGWVYARERRQGAQPG
ncbi:MAG TPA: ABC transporter permease [Streptosporangiaceae bacterium]|jgi:hypothetical protein